MSNTLPAIDVSDLVDLDRYPIEDLSTPEAQAVIAQAKKDLVDSGAAMFPGFLTAEGLAKCVAEVEALKHDAYARDIQRWIYDQSTLDPSLPEDHPFRQGERLVQRMLSADLFDGESHLRRLYEWGGMNRFVAAVLEQEVHPIADPFLQLAVIMMNNGEKHDWHFDGTDWVLTLLLQRPESGGEFEFVPHTRNAENPGLDRVEAVLRGTSDEVVSITQEPGTLVLFYGDLSLHRVAPSHGAKERMVATFSYDSEPGFVFDESIHFRASGRTEPRYVSPRFSASVEG